MTSRLHQSFSQRGRHLQSSQARLPEELKEPGLLVGWSLEAEHATTPIGFGFGDPKLTPSEGWIDPVLLEGEGHLMTIAPTGTGKGRSCIIPALLRHTGPAIVVDPKGENVAVTARKREEMGHKVIVLDPMEITNKIGGSFNPLDLIEATSADAVDLAGMLANTLIDGKNDPKNQYWYQRAQHLLTGIILHVCTEENTAIRNFERVREILAELVGKQGVKKDPLRDELLQSPHPESRLAATILQNQAPEGLGSILSMAQDGVDFLRGPRLMKATRDSSFELDAITRGDLVTIYLVMPPHMLESHGRLLRLWINGLLSLITRRRGRPPASTLFILDEAAQLGSLPQLRQAVTLLRGYGVQTWSFWQDLSQLKFLYPGDWETMVNNCWVLQAFGSMNQLASEAIAELTGFGSPQGYEVLALDNHEMILQIAGDGAVVARKPDYLSDPAFKGLYDQNPYHDPDQPIMPPPPPKIDLHPRRAEPPKKRFEVIKRPTVSDEAHRDLLKRLIDGTQD